MKSRRLPFDGCIRIEGILLQPYPLGVCEARGIATLVSNAGSAGARERGARERLRSTI